MYKRKRELDGIYFRVKRDNKYDNVCFSDLTEEEKSDVLENRSVEWLKNLCMELGSVIRIIGDELDLSMAYEDDGK